MSEGLSNSLFLLGCGTFAWICPRCFFAACTMLGLLGVIVNLWNGNF